METTQLAPTPGILSRVALAAVLAATFTAIQAVAMKPWASLRGSASYDQSTGVAKAGDCAPVAPCTIELASQGSGSSTR
jgi:hypothetical protein